jgi:hypothetical protein
MNNIRVWVKALCKQPGCAHGPTGVGVAVPRFVKYIVSFPPVRIALFWRMARRSALVSVLLNAALSSLQSPSSP